MNSRLIQQRKNVGFVSNKNNGTSRDLNYWNNKKNTLLVFRNNKTGLIMKRQMIVYNNTQVIDRVKDRKNDTTNFKDINMISHQQNN